MRPGDPRYRPTDEPVIEEVRVRGAVAFEPRAVVAGRRSSTSLALWAVIVSVALGIGVLGQHVDVTDHGLAMVESPSPDPTESAHTPAPTDDSDGAPRLGPESGAAGVDPVVLISSSFGPLSVTSQVLDIEGYVNVRATYVDVSVEAQGLDPIATSRVYLPVLDGIRPEAPPSFAVSFDLPEPRPDGVMWVSVAAFDTDGFLVAGIRRPFLSGPLLEAHVAPKFH